MRDFIPHKNEENILALGVGCVQCKVYSVRETGHWLPCFFVYIIAKVVQMVNKTHVLYKNICLIQKKVVPLQRILREYTIQTIYNGCKRQPKLTKKR